MAVSKKGQRYSVKVEYKPEYDETGERELDAYTQTFTRVAETASTAELKAYADALMSLTIYANAPYKVYLIDNSELVTV